MVTRRKLLQWGGGAAAGTLVLWMSGVLRMKKRRPGRHVKTITADGNAAVSHIYLAKNGSPRENMNQVLDMMGGIRSVIGDDDIVIIKPNGQWRYHGNTNTDTISGFIDMILAIPGFRGEVIVAENHHDASDNMRGWTTPHRNGRFNLNELVAHYQASGFPNVTKCHWRDAGPNPHPLQFPGGGGKRVSGPEDGDGYVWSAYNYEYLGRKVKMSYPVFTSAFSGIRIDFQRGAWKNGKYFQNRPVRFVNFAVLNHHSRTFGVTASVKNYLGVVDMTCGEQGTEPPGYYNFHYIAVGWSRQSGFGRWMETVKQHPVMRQSRILSKGIRKSGPVMPEAMGGAVGYFMNTIRKADLNILAAEYCGHEDRLSAPRHTRTVLASTDPVALDFWASKHVLCPLGGRRARYNDPENRTGPFRRMLEGCHAQGIGILDEKRMKVHQYDFQVG